MKAIVIKFKDYIKKNIFKINIGCAMNKTKVSKYQ